LLVLLVAVLCTLTEQKAIPKAIPTAWSQELGLRYLYFSYGAYCSESSLKAWNCKWCTTNETTGFKPTFQVHSVKTDMRGYGGYFSQYNTIVVAFRGSSSIRNWIEDLENIKLVNYKNSTTMKIGDGWNHAYDSVRTEVLNGVKSLVKSHPSAPIAVTGHSLGAAVASTCAVDLVESGYPNTYLYDYGEPRVGNAAFASYSNSLIKAYYRVVNGKDIVPSLPYQFLGFTHSHTEVWENPADSLNFKVCSSTNGEDPKCSDSIIADSAADHLEYFGIHESC